MPDLCTCPCHATSHPERFGRALLFTTGLPPAELNPNGRKHRLDVRRAIRDYREEVALCALEAMKGRRLQFHRVRVCLVFREGFGRPKRDGRYRPRDVWNAASAWKAGFDGLVDSGICIDDSHAYMEAGSVVIQPHGTPPGVEVLVLEVLG